MPDSTEHTFEPCERLGHKDCMHYRAFMFAMGYFSTDESDPAEIAITRRYRERLRKLQEMAR